MALHDTAPEIRRRQLVIYRAMSADQRVELAFAMSEGVRRIALEGIRGRNPEFDEAVGHVERLRMLHADELVAPLVSHHSAR